MYRSISQALLQYSSKFSRENSLDSQSNMSHLELFDYIHNRKSVLSSDLYERYTVSKQTIRSRLKFLEKSNLIYRLEKHNLGGNGNSTTYACSKNGEQVSKQWPFRSSVQGLSIATAKISVRDREPAINLLQLAVLASIADLRGVVYTSKIIENFSNISESTTQRRLSYLVKKGLIKTESLDNRACGVSRTVGYTYLGQELSQKLNLK